MHLKIAINLCWYSIVNSVFQSEGKSRSFAILFIRFQYLLITSNMLRIQDIKENWLQIEEGLRKKRVSDAPAKMQHLIDLDQKRKDIQTRLDELLNQSNTLSKQIGGLMQSGKREEAEAAKKQTAELKTSIRELQEAQNNVDEKLTEALYNVPNAAHANVPDGAGADDNTVVLVGGHMPDLIDEARPHWDLIERYNIIDFELGTKLTGAGFPVYKGKGAKLQRALINFFLNEADKAGYLEIQPPIMINAESGYATGQLPDKEGQMYEVTAEKFYLIPTAEVPITNLYRNVILEEKDLPIKNVGYTPCFRREAGSWGAHVRGLNRLHQFDKVEIVQITTAAHSYDALEEMCIYVEGLLEKLELPYRRLLLCGGDMGFTSAMTFDLEVYAGAQKKWLEVSSISNFETYQSNRLKLRYKDAAKKPSLLHTLNGSALALPRIVAALLENNQTLDSIKIPKALVPYTGFDTIE
jgi:seryl-tRNA synthetase